jgi:aryl-alcohol dehydrogenase-like predicted oxidoreductase
VVPFEETLGVLGELVGAGKVRWIGTSTFAAWMLADALALAREQGLPAVASEQPPYNLLDRRADNELLPMCEHHHVAVVPWSPLAGGVLAGRYDRLDSVPADSRAALVPMTRDRMNERALDVARAVGELARERGLTTSQLALLWTKDQPGVTAPIIGPRTLAQLDDALGVLDLSLDDDARAACDVLVHPGNAVSDFYSTAFWMRAEVGPDNV